MAADNPLSQPELLKGMPLDREAIRKALDQDPNSPEVAAAITSQVNQARTTEELKEAEQAFVLYAKAMLANIQARREELTTAGVQEPDQPQSEANEVSCTAAIIELEELDRRLKKEIATSKGVRITVGKALKKFLGEIDTQDWDHDEKNEFNKKLVRFRKEMACREAAYGAESKSDAEKYKPSERAVPALSSTKIESRNLEELTNAEKWGLLKQMEDSLQRDIVEDSADENSKIAFRRTDKTMTEVVKILAKAALDFGIAWEKVWDEKFLKALAKWDGIRRENIFQSKVLEAALSGLDEDQRAKMAHPEFFPEEDWPDIQNLRKVLEEMQAEAEGVKVNSGLLLKLRDFFGGSEEAESLVYNLRKLVEGNQQDSFSDWREKTHKAIYKYAGVEPIVTEAEVEEGIKFDREIHHKTMADSLNESGPGLTPNYVAGIQSAGSQLNWPGLPKKESVIHRAIVGITSRE